MTTKTKKPGAAPDATAVPGAYSVDDLAAAFKRAGLDIQWVGRDQGKPMTMGSLELTELLKVVAELPVRAPAGAPGAAAQSPLPTAITQAAPADLFADAIARLAAHDHAAATDLADKYRASLHQPPAGAADDGADDDIAAEVKTALHEVARRGYVNPDDVSSIIGLFPRAAALKIDPSERISVPGFDYPTTYGELATLPAEKLWNRYKTGRALDARTAFLVARAIPFVYQVAVPELANELKVAQATLERVYEIIGLGAEARKPSILLTNIENAVRRTACLSRIESIMTTVRIEEGEEVEECPMNWGAGPEEYAEQFRVALTQQAKVPAVVPGYKLVVFDELSPEGCAVSPFVIDAERALTFHREPGWLASHIEDLYRMETPIPVPPDVPLIPLTGYGQVQKGDVLLVKRGNEFIAPVEVKDVLQAGTKDEEIILSAAKNVYFIVRKFLAGESWIKECSKLVNGRIYSITNNQRDILCNSRDDRAVRAPRATAAEEDQA